jgi:phosphate transport system substrate-binding protein
MQTCSTTTYPTRWNDVREWCPRASVAFVALSLALLLPGCGENKPGPNASTAGASGGTSGDEISAEGIDLSGLSGLISIDGSSTVFPVTEAVAEEFQKATKQKVRVKVGHAGTGSGFRQFLRGELDVCDASRPILKSEMEGAQAAGIEYIELPICFDALTVAVHPSNKLSSITVSELKTIWSPESQKRVSRWNQVRADWPDAELALFGAGSESGTFDYFTEAIVGKAKSSRGDYTASEDDNTLVQGIAGNRYALGYIPFAYFDQNKDKMKALAIDWEKGAGPVLPTLDNVVAGKYNPLSRPLFLYVSRKSADRPEVKAFVKFYLQNVKPLATEVGYLPLPEAVYKMDSDRFKELQVGTGFGGEQAVGLAVEEIIKREPGS